MIKIKCKCGYETPDYADMINHLSQTQDNKKNNCKNKVIEIED